MRTRTHFTMAYTLGLFIFFVTYNCSSVCSAPVDHSPAQYIFEHCSYKDQTHPILNVKAGDGLGKRALTKSDFSELSHYSPPVCNVIWSRDFNRAEREAALQCCKSLIGSKMNEIEHMLGQAPYRVGHQDLAEITLGRVLWMYKFGGNQIPLKLTFSGDQCISASVANWEKEFEDRIFPKDVPDVKYHPLLKVLPNQKLQKGKLENRIYRKLKNYRTIGFHAAWERGFGQVEVEASERFCATAIGKNEQDIFNLAGAPLYKGHNIPGWLCAKTGNDIWLYRFGGTNVRVRAIFKNHKCIICEIYDDADDFNFSRWREKEIMEFAPGKTIQQIITREGIPDGALEGHPFVEYLTDSSSFVDLYFKHGRCEKAVPGAYAH